MCDMVLALLKSPAVPVSVGSFNEQKGYGFCLFQQRQDQRR